LTNGFVFNSTTTLDPTPLDGFIEGWKIGIPKFGRDGSGMLLIPSALGYGSRDLGVIPPNSVLLFDVTLEDF
ncbi:MAG: FKBP-type peptidyl-prolyl cis-trans isomerase, partial [Bacteroidota bacterium]